LELLDRVAILERDLRVVAEELSDLDTDEWDSDWVELGEEADELRHHLVRLWAQVEHSLGLEIPLRRWDVSCMRKDTRRVSNQIHHGPTAIDT
jgi:hypothetical protein